MATLQTLAGATSAESGLKVLWCISTLMLGDAAVHPSVVQVDTPAPAGTQEVGPLRLAAPAVASFLAPAALFVQFLRGAPLHVPLICAACSVLFLLLIARLAGLAAAQRRMAITDERTGLHTRRHLLRALKPAFRVIPAS